MVITATASTPLDETYRPHEAGVKQKIDFVELLCAHVLLLQFAKLLGWGKAVEEVQKVK